MINLPLATAAEEEEEEDAQTRGPGGEPLQTLAEKKEKLRQICQHSACSLDLMHIVSLSDGAVKERAI